VKSNGDKAAKAKKVRIKINRDMCKGCGICIAFCPQGVFELNQDEKALAPHAKNCNACGMCELLCPDMAIEVKQAKNESHNEREHQS
jgi:2-oxoglutarate ferredoxin oxidoreductase subunit delta